MNSPASRDQTATARPSWLLPVTVATLAYLVVEFGFNSRLLDVVGGGADDAAIHAIERWGRCLSGFAVALAFWPFLIERGRRWGLGFSEHCVRLFKVSTVIILLVYGMEYALVEWLVSRTTPEERADAQRLVWVQQGLLNSQVDLGGLDLQGDALKAPDVKAFLAVMPLMGWSIDGIEKQVGNRVLTTLLEGEAIRQFGDFYTFFERFKVVRTKLRESYTQYEQASVEIETKFSREELDGAQAEAWSQYLLELERQRWTPRRVPNSHLPKVITTLATKGIRVPADWQPWDRYRFDIAVEKNFYDKADRLKRAGLQKAGLPEDTPLGLSWKEFVALPAVVDGFKKDSHIPNKASIHLAANSAEAAESRIYRPALKAWVDEQTTRQIGNSPAAAESRESAVRTLLVPPIALAFSLVGALAHVAKSGIYLAMTFSRWRPSSPKKLGLVVAITLSLVSFGRYWPAGLLPNQPLFATLVAKTESLGGVDGKPTPGGTAVSALVQASIRSQPALYPIFEWTRVHLLGSFSFGYHPDENRSP